MMRALLALALVACASPPATFSAQAGLESATRAAVVGWSRALPCSMDVRYVTHDADVVVEWHTVPDVTPGSRTFGEGGVKGRQWAAWGDLDAWVYVDPETPAELVPLVVAHEIGHSLRAPHSANERDLMYRTYVPEMSAAPTDRDGRAVCEVWGY